MRRNPSVAINSIICTDVDQSFQASCHGFLNRHFPGTQNKMLIPTPENPNMYFLGPSGNPYPSEFICSETIRVPYKNSSMDLDEWQGSFRAWPNQIKGWLNWFHCLLATKQVLWDEVGINQCLTLSPFDMEWNDSFVDGCFLLLDQYFECFCICSCTGECYFNLASVVMLTGFNIQYSVSPFSLMDPVSDKIATREISGWAKYTTLIPRRAL